MKFEMQCLVCGAPFERTAGQIMVAVRRGGAIVACSQACAYQHIRERPARSTYGRRHRRAAAEMLGRPLRAGEAVHHINGDPSDNRPENLQVLDAAEHQRLHHQIYTEDSRCSVAGCASKPEARGMCQRHYAQDHYRRTKNRDLERAA